MRQSAPNGRQCEERNADAEDQFPAVVVAERTSYEQQRCEKKRVRFDNPLHVANGGVQVCLQGREGYINGRTINKRHA